ncbi:MAG: hypothetical protein A3G59_02235 [Candidatus Taylorbacteria bacterium RIFCSPLOWO2_12_FULL_47_20]|uniref:HIT domain-containing protein n=2 Tax=Candidatus Tayloriibacteriota TaxID=1817919 RepID=A0A1G2P856_9BACT|nr:MAG: hypothetical protein A3H68_03690 [Candidatus Taylorbacteria bacterium RIFCSPLOWO2_02_FULL_46_40]OHA44500.1 MAG: hypothetical protein A3G59_02235 [Candidatus Taylorbacteria bacterium RIFCSPLOWO2_12_FULL_47_20]
MRDCIFCKIAKGEIPTETIIYRGKDVCAFLDIKPVNLGHTLVIPNEHYEDIFDLPEDIISAMMRAAKKVAEAIKISLKAGGVNIGMNNGAHAGQIIFHGHIHVIPRFEGDGYKLWKNKKNHSQTELKEAADKIKSAIS